MDEIHHPFFSPQEIHQDTEQITSGDVQAKKQDDLFGTMMTTEHRRGEEDGEDLVIAVTSKEADGHHLVKSETKTVGMWGVTDPNEAVTLSASNHKGKPAKQKATLDLSYGQPTLKVKR
jgi:hypothetical protein